MDHDNAVERYEEIVRIKQKLDEAASQQASMSMAAPLLAISEINASLDKVRQYQISINKKLSELLSNHPLQEYKLMSLRPPKINIPETDYPSLITLVLIVSSSFMYIGNFYLLSVAAKEYLSYLDMPESFSGFLTALNWGMAIVCGLLYSWWSNYQFKIPTAFCAFIAAVGNLIYFMAWDMNAVTLLFIGRFLIGVGGPRVLNRRYILAYTSIRVRTRWTAFYISGTLLGMAIGPFLAACLYTINTTIGGATVNGINSPALVMAIIWLLYTVTTILWFVEPDIPKKLGDTGSTTVTSRVEEEETEFRWLPTLLAVWTLFFPKVVQEAFIISAPIVCGIFFDWNVVYIGFFLALVSLVVTPTHLFIWITRQYIQDRQFLIAAKIICAIGALLLINFSNMSMAQYIIGSIILFLATVITDPISTALTSNIISKNTHKELLNAGYITTFTGSLGRAFGGIVVAIAGISSSLYIENNLFIPLTVICGISAVLTVLAYPIMTIEALHPAKKKVQYY